MLPSWMIGPLVNLMFRCAWWAGLRYAHVVEHNGNMVGIVMAWSRESYEAAFNARATTGGLE